MKDIQRDNPVRFADQVEFSDAPVFKKIVETKHGDALLVALKAGQVIAEHEVDAMALATVVEGEVNFVVEGSNHDMKMLDSMVMAPHTKHSVEAVSDAKIYLVRINA